MTGFVGQLRARLGLDTAQFDQNLRGAQTRARTGLGGAFAAAGRLIRPLTLGLASAGVAAAAIAAPALRGAAAIDDMAKSARRIDSSIAGWAALRQLAAEAGVNTAILADQVQNLNARLADPNTATTEALAALGLEARELRELDGDARLAAIADAVERLGYDAGQTSALLRTLGIEDRRMVNLIAAGGPALRRARQDIEDYGLAISDIDAARIEEANDRIGRLGVISQYFGQQLAIAVVPALGDMAQALTESMREGGALRRVIDTIVAGVRWLVADFRTFIQSLRDTGRQIYDFGDVVVGVWQWMVEKARAIPVGLSAIWNTVKADFYLFIGNLTERWAGFLQVFSDTVPDVGLFDGMRESLGEARADALRFMGDLRQAHAQARIAAHEAGEAWNNAGSEGLARARAALARLRGEIVQTGTETTETAETLTELDLALRRAAQNTDPLASGMGQIGQAAQDTEQRIGSAAQRLSQFILSAVRDWRGALSRLTEMLSERLLTRGIEILLGGGGLGGSGGGGLLRGLIGLIGGPSSMASPALAAPARIASPAAASEQNLNVIVSVDDEGALRAVVDRRVNAGIQRVRPQIVGESVRATRASFREFRPE